MADNVYDDGNASGLWSDDDSWVPGHTPIVTERALVDGTTDNNLTVDENAACDGVATTGAYDGNIDFGDGLSHAWGSSGFVLAHTGATDAGTGTTHTITDGAWDPYPAKAGYNEATSHFIFAGTCTVRGERSSADFYDLTINSGAVVTLQYPHVGVTNSFTNNGTLYVHDLLSQAFRVDYLAAHTWGNDSTINGPGLFAITSGVKPTRGTNVTIDCNIHIQYAAALPAGAYGGTVFWYTGAYTWVLDSGSYDFASDFTLQSAGAMVFDLSNNPIITIGGDWTLNVAGGASLTLNASTAAVVLEGDLVNLVSGTFDPGEQDITFQSTAAQNFDPCGTNRWGEVTVDKTAGGVTLDADLYCTALTGTDGTLDLNGFDVDVSGAVALASGFVVSNPAGSTIDCNTFSADGQDFSVATGAWYINAATSATITGGVTINYLDARGGVEVNAEGCVKGIECYNVNFGVNRRRRLLICGRRAA